MTHTFSGVNQEGTDFETVRSDVQEAMNELTYRVLYELMYEENDICAGQDYFGSVLMIYTALSMKKGMWHIGIPQAGQLMEPIVSFGDAADLVASLYLYQNTVAVETEAFPLQLELMEV